ncbi:MAG: formylglycine-generating enzyme family protein [Desulfobacteraceae bacterium]|nr:formylglycine-generating enzyme family protein [Desulfobacteraceae bacterium]
MLEGSISLTLEEKQRVIDAIPRLNTWQIDELISIFEEERQKFAELETKFEKDVTSIKKARYNEINQASLFDNYLQSLKRFEQNTSPFGVNNMAGDIYEMTVSEASGKYIIKGGFWFSANPEQECMAWASDTIKPREKRMDIGFRCVKPIFSKDDLGVSTS